MNEVGATTSRVPVSLRIPAAIMEEVDAYAARNGVRRTDAFLRYLQMGIDKQRDACTNDRLSSIETQIDTLTKLMMEFGKALVSDDEKKSFRSQHAFNIARHAIRETAEKYPAIREAYLFGSVARGEANDESDVDVRLVIDRDEHFNLHDLEHFCKTVEHLTGHEVDVVTASTIKNTSLAKAIERDKVMVYEREKH